MALKYNKKPVLDNALDTLLKDPNVTVQQTTTQTQTTVEVKPPETKTETKTKKKTKVKVEEVNEVELLTSLYIGFHTQYLERGVKQLIDQMETVRKKLQLIANDNFPAEEPVVFACEEGQVVFTKRQKECAVKDAFKLLKDLTDKFGTDAAYSVVKVGITELKTLLSETEMLEGGYVEYKPGSRSVKEVHHKQVEEQG